MIVSKADYDKYGELEECHKKLFILLLEFDSFCKKNEINYSLAFGTLIGAIRHKGFIPWDDDLDVAMDRPNYNKFLKCISQSTKYEVRRKQWVRAFKRKNDRWSIDVFPYDNVPDSKIIAKIKLLLLKVLQGMIDDKKDISKFGFAFRAAIRITSVIGKLFSIKTKQRWYDKAMVIGNKNKTKFISGYGCSFASLSVYQPRNLFSSYVNVVFEGEDFSAVKQYDLYLRNYFGDYMIPPAACDRVPPHVKRTND